MKTIQLTQDKIALVDDADFEAVNQVKWYALKKGRQVYAVRSVCKQDGKRTLLLLHRFLLPEAKEIDHRDGDGLNNQRNNLRAVSSSQNHQAFHRKAEGKSSRFRGVSWFKRDQKWQAQIQLDGKKSYLGYFQSEQEAALAYDVAAKQLFGEFASPNFS